jgi:hypothetical protein
MSIDGKKHAFFSKNITGDQSADPYNIIWSPDSKELMLHLPAYSGRAGGLVRIEIASKQTKLLIADKAGTAEFFVPQSWSPDGKWAVIQQYPDSDSVAYLLNLDDNSLSRLPLSKASNWVTPIGWVN